MSDQLIGQLPEGALQGRVIVVTGAGRGQGYAEALALAEAGARVIACDIVWPEETLDRTPEGDLTLPGAGSLERRVLDVSKPEQWSELANWISTNHGVVHGLVNNAGLAFRARLGEITLEDWERVFRVNVTGAMLGMQALTPLMTSGGSIVNIGSLASVTAHPAVAYTASKWALRGLSKVASMTLGDKGIRSNLINPGFIATTMTDATPSSFRVANIQNTSLARPGGVEDVVPVVMFLLSDASSFITGAEIAVDGGQSGHAGAKPIFDAEQNALLN